MSLSAKLVFRLPGTVLLLLLLPACGYQLVGHGRNLPEHIRNISVPIFKNVSTEYGLEKVLTYAVIDQFDRHGGYQIVRSDVESDAILKGIIRRYDYYPIRRSDLTISEYRVTITTHVELYDQVEKQIFWQDDNFIFTQKYSVEGSISAFQDNRNQAWQDAAEDFAETLVSVILEGF